MILKAEITSYSHIQKNDTTRKEAILIFSKSSNNLWYLINAYVRFNISVNLSNRVTRDALKVVTPTRVRAGRTIKWTLVKIRKCDVMLSGKAFTYTLSEPREHVVKMLSWNSFLAVCRRCHLCMRDNSYRICKLFIKRRTHCSHVHLSFLHRAMTRGLTIP